MSNTLTQQSTIKQVPYSKGILETIRKRMDKEDYNFLLCETTPDGLYHKEYWMCKNQEIVNEFLDTYESNSLWYISNYDKSIKLSIDYDWKILIIILLVLLTERMKVKKSNTLKDFIPT